MTRFAALELSEVNETARPLVAGSKAHFGFVPSPVAKAARSPLLLKQLLGALGSLDHTSLSLVEREVLAMTVAYENDCHYCMAMHSTLLSRNSEHAELIASLRAGQSLAEPRLEALRLFVLSLLRENKPSEEALARMEQVGFGEEQVLEVLLGVSAYWLSTRTNVLTDVQLDAPFQAQAWQKPTGATR